LLYFVIVVGVFIFGGFGCHSSPRSLDMDRRGIIDV
jgi:hypothetical protein